MSVRRTRAPETQTPRGTAAELLAPLEALAPAETLAPMGALAEVERCAGAIVVRRDEGAVLLIRTRARRWELPKGHLEAGEHEVEAALRELSEETAIEARLHHRGRIATLDYRFGRPGGAVHKRVAYHLFVCDDAAFGALPAGIRARRFVGAAEIASIPLRSENARPLLQAALAAAREGEGSLG